MQIKYFTVVPYSTEQMFNLINNINAYAEFIPGCISSRILEQHDREMLAEINISKAGIKKSLKTHNIFIENTSIVIQLVEGPFTSLYGYWRFIQLNKKNSIVELFLDYQFKNKLLEIAFSQILKNQDIASYMIKTFIYRAKKVYSK